MTNEWTVQLNCSTYQAQAETRIHPLERIKWALIQSSNWAYYQGKNKPCHRWLSPVHIVGDMTTITDARDQIFQRIPRSLIVLVQVDRQQIFGDLWANDRSVVNLTPSALFLSIKAQLELGVHNCH